MDAQQRWIQDMLKIARVSFETGMQSMDLSEAQAQKTIEAVIAGSEAIKADTEAVLKDWQSNVKRAG